MPEETPIGYVVWFSRRRSYLNKQGYQSGAPTLDDAKLFTSHTDAQQEAEKFSYVYNGTQKSEPFQVNQVGIRLLGELSA